MTGGPFMSMHDMQALKDYVRSNETGMRQAESTVLLHVKHSHLNANFHEIRFDMHVSTALPGPHAGVGPLLPSIGAIPAHRPAPAPRGRAAGRA